MEVYYKCDPSKNFTCKKANCFINGGPCTQTKDKAYAMDPDRVLLVAPLEPEMLEGVPGTRRLRRELARKKKKEQKNNDAE